MTRIADDWTSPTANNRELQNNLDAGAGSSGAPPGATWYFFRIAADERTCPVCRPLAGVPVRGDDYAQHPPLHTNCRCWLDLWYTEAPSVPVGSDPNLGDGPVYDPPPSNVPPSGGGGGSNPGPY